jgi:hypothetical protein
LKKTKNVEKVKRWHKKSLLCKNEGGCKRGHCHY